MALRAGLHDVVKASITGSIIGNILLVFGFSILVAGVKSQRLSFNRTAATMGATLLTLAGIGLIVPAVFHYVAIGQDPSHELELSTEIAVVLFLTYILSLFFVLKTHSHLYTGGASDEDAKGQHRWSASWARRLAVSRPDWA